MKVLRLQFWDGATPVTDSSLSQIRPPFRTAPSWAKQ
jgi:hypothetical protein